MSEHWNDTLSAEDVFPTSTQTLPHSPTPWQRQLSPAPRFVPFLVRCRFLLTLEMGFMAWFLFFFSTLVVFSLFWFWGNGRDFLPECVAAWETLPTQGWVTESEESGLSINDVPIQEHTFSWISPQGEEISGKCYSDELLSQDEPVTIQRSGKAYRIVNTTLGAIGGSPWMLLLVMIFPAAAMFLIWLAFRKGGKLLRLLAYGETSPALATRQEPTGTIQNEHREWRVFYTFQDSGGKLVETSIRTLSPPSPEEQIPQTLLYNPEKPQEAMILEEYLPEMLTLSESGDFQLSAKSRRILLWLAGLAALWGMGLWWMIQR
ncbi:MAG: hypothetical protein Q4E67_02225 [Planctomycetia bacterium]|nr:hypothetical protein [Planctomycetia bacterium]